jgi:MFS transporter, MFS domain-containing protein family, molybdate-anion transporter
MNQFVFMWVPTMLSLDPPGGLPTGCVFSALMMAISCGGMVFPLLHWFISKYVVSKSNAPEVCASLVYLMASLSMILPAMCLSASRENPYYFAVIVASFMIVEFCVGLFMPIAGTLRSKYVPDALQGGILNIFRLPLNTIVVSGTYATDVFAPADVFKLVSASFFLAAMLQATMVFTKPDAPKPALKKD